MLLSLMSFTIRTTAFADSGTVLRVEYAHLLICASRCLNVASEMTLTAAFVAFVTRFHTLLSTVNVDGFQPCSALADRRNPAFFLWLMAALSGSTSLYDTISALENWETPASLV